MMIALDANVFGAMPLEHKAMFQACVPDVAFGVPAFAVGEGRMWMVIRSPLISQGECEAMMGVADSLGIPPECRWFGDLPPEESLPDGWAPCPPPGFEEPIV